MIFKLLKFLQIIHHLRKYENMSYKIKNQCQNDIISKTAHSPNSGHYFFEPFQYKINRRTEGRVLKGGMRPFNKFPAVGIGIVFTVAGPLIVNAAKIICAEERTGTALNHIIAVFVQPEVGLDKNGFFHSQMPGDAFDVWRFKTGADGFAAVGALEAVDVGKSFFMQSGQCFLQAFPFPGLQLF